MKKPLLNRLKDKFGIDILAPVVLNKFVVALIFFMNFISVMILSYIGNPVPSLFYNIVIAFILLVSNARKKNN